MAEAPNPDRPIRVAAISDLHGCLPTDFPRCDVAVLAGDVLPIEEHSLTVQRRWLIEVFAPWLTELPVGTVIGIGGNHDRVFERPGPPIAECLPWSYLRDDPLLTRGLWVWGTPWVPWLAHGWAFQSPAEGKERFLAEKYEAIPVGLDVLVSHGPPRGLLDRTIRGVSVGSVALRDTLRRTRPRICVVGHIHESRGFVCDPDSGVLVANVSAMNEDYEPHLLPVPVFDLPRHGGPAVVIDGFD